MKKSKFSERQIISILNEHTQGKTVATICLDHKISQQTFYKWRSKYSGMDISQLKRVRELEALVAHYKKIVAEQVVDIQVLKDLMLKNASGPIDKRRAVAYSMQEHAISIRRACKLLGTHPSLIIYQRKLKSEMSVLDQSVTLAG
jgi:putative transposase